MSARPANILVVDDEPALRSFAGALLQDLGYSAALAESGRAAVQQLLQDPEAIDAVLLDMSMPGMRPEETFRLLREIHPGLPVIVLSGDTEASVRKRFGPGTIAGYVSKPYTDLELEQALAQALAEPVADLVAELVPVAPTTFKLVRLSEDEISAIGGQYLSTCRTQLGRTTELLAMGDFVALRAIGHSLKGGAGCFGFAALSSAGRALEGYAEASNLAACAHQLAILHQHLARLESKTIGSSQ